MMDEFSVVCIDGHLYLVTYDPTCYATRLGFKRVLRYLGVRDDE